MAKRTQTYRSGEVTVTFDPNVCTHAAACVRGLPAVFDVSKKRWVRLENAPAQEVLETVKRCPSGALQATSSGDCVPD